jgi:hypothetical protein
MFSLVISIIVIALGAVLIVVSSNYSGDSMNEGTVKAKVSQYKNEAHQISSTLTMYKVEKGGFKPCSDTDGSGTIDSNDEFAWECLVNGGYLKTLPQTTFTNSGEAQFSWGIRDNVIFLPNISDDVCVTANRVDGYQTEFSTEPTATTVFGPNGEQSPAGFQLVEDDSYIPVCADGLSDRVPCCFDSTPAS